MKSFGEQIRETRVAKKMTLRALAITIGVSAPFLSDVEHGRRKLTEERIAQFEKVLGVKFERPPTIPKDVIDYLIAHPEMIDLIRSLRDKIFSPPPPQPRPSFGCPHDRSYA